MKAGRIRKALLRKIGPLPVWAWALVAGGALWYYRRKTAAVPADPASSTDPGLAPLDTGTAPFAGGTSGDPGAVDPGSPSGGDLPLDPLPPLDSGLLPPDVLPPPDTLPPPPTQPPPTTPPPAGKPVGPVSHGVTTSAAARTRAAAVHARQVQAARIRRSNQLLAFVRLRHVTPALQSSPAFQGALSAPHTIIGPLPAGASAPHVLVAPLTGGRYSA